MLNPDSKIQGCMLKGFKDILTFILHFSSVIVQCFSFVAQVVTSQTEKRKPSDRVFIVIMPDYWNQWS